MDKGLAFRPESFPKRIGGEQRLANRRLLPRLSKLPAVDGQLVSVQMSARDSRTTTGYSTDNHSVLVKAEAVRTGHGQFDFFPAMPHDSDGAGWPMSDIFDHL